MPNTFKFLQPVLSLSDRRFLAYSLGLAFLLRLIWIEAVSAFPIDDFGFYFDQASNLASGKGYVDAAGEPTAYFPVGYPLLLSMFFRITGPSVELAKLINLAFSVGCVYLTYLIALLATNDRKTARVSAIIMAIFPNQIAYTSLTSDSILTQFLLLAITAILLYKPRGWWLLTVGFLTGALTLVRPYLVVIPFIILLFSVKKIGWREFFAQCGVIAMATAILVYPWIHRNVKAFGEFTFVSTNGGINLLIGHNANATGTYMIPNLDSLGVTMGVTEVDKDAIARKRAIESITGNPGRSIVTVPKKIFYLFAEDFDAIKWIKLSNDVQGKPPTTDGSVPSMSVLSYPYSALEYVAIGGFQLYYIAIWIAAMWFVIRHFRKKNVEVKIGPIPWTMIAFFAAIAIVFFGAPRFHFPVVPFLCIPAAAVIRTMLGNPNDRR